MDWDPAGQQKKALSCCDRSGQSGMTIIERADLVSNCNMNYEVISQREKCIVIMSTAHVHVLLVKKLVKIIHMNIFSGCTFRLESNQRSKLF